MSTQIPLAALEAFRSPFINDVWRCGLITRTMVEQAIAQGNSLDWEAWQLVQYHSEGGVPTAQDHAARIAYLVQHGWTDAVAIDVGIPFLGHFIHWPYEDGNHRICAAIIRGDTHIAADVSGDIDHAKQIFGVSVVDAPQEESN